MKTRETLAKHIQHGLRWDRKYALEGADILIEQGLWVKGRKHQRFGARHIDFLFYLPDSWMETGAPPAPGTKLKIKGIDCIWREDNDPTETYFDGVLLLEEQLGRKIL